MADSSSSTQPAGANPARALDEGRRQGLAIAAFALGLVSFLNLLGAEKSILAIVLAAVAMAGAGPASRQVRRRALLAIGLALLHLVTIALVLVLFRDELGQLIGLLQQLG